MIAHWHYDELEGNAKLALLVLSELVGVALKVGITYLTYNSSGRQGAYYVVAPLYCQCKVLVEGIWFSAAYYLFCNNKLQISYFVRWLRFSDDNGEEISASDCLQFQSARM